MPALAAPNLASLLRETAPAELKEALQRLEGFARDSARAVNASLVVGDTLQFWTPTTQKACTVTVPTDWVSLTPLAPWVAFGGAFAAPAYRKDSSGRVSLKGLLKSGGLSTPLFSPVLPSGFRPSDRLVLSAISNNGTTDLATRVDVYPTGDVQQVGGGNSFLSLDGLSFQASDSSPYVPSCFPVDLALNLQGLPRFVLVSAVESTTSGDALTSPVNVALAAPDWTVTSAGGQRFLRLRNVPGLVPARTYGLTVAAFGGF